MTLVDWSGMLTAGPPDPLQPTLAELFRLERLLSRARFVLVVECGREWYRDVVAQVRTP